MSCESLTNDIEKLCKTSGWRSLAALIEGGYKGLFVILRVIRDRGGAAFSGDLAKAAGVSTARVASALNCLQKKGFVVREREKTDARRVLVKLTEQGAFALAKREEQIALTLKPMAQNLSEKETEILLDLLNSFCNNFGFKK